MLTRQKENYSIFLKPLGTRTDNSDIIIYTRISRSVHAVKDVSLVRMLRYTRSFDANQKSPSATELPALHAQRPLPPDNNPCTHVAYAETRRFARTRQQPATIKLTRNVIRALSRWKKGEASLQDITIEMTNYCGVHPQLYEISLADLRDLIRRS